MQHLIQQHIETCEPYGILLKEKEVSFLFSKNHKSYKSYMCLHQALQRVLRSVTIFTCFERCSVKMHPPLSARTPTGLYPKI